MRALLVDDETRSRANLKLLLEDYCLDVVICGEAASAKEALKLVDELHPDLLFLDIQMPTMNGIDLAYALEKLHLPVIFVTAYDQFAIQALRASAVDYLLKPVTIAELQGAVAKAAKLIGKRKRKPELDPIRTKLDTLSENLKSRTSIKRVSLPWEGGFKVLDVDDIVYIKADNVYSEVQLSDRNHFVFSFSIGEFEDLLKTESFFRIHNSYLINLALVDSFSVKEGGIVQMKDGSNLPVARRRISGFREASEAFFQHG